MVSDNQEIYTDIEKRVELRFRRRRNFAFHAVLFMAGVSVVWTVLSWPDGDETPLLMILIWGTIFVLHGLHLLFYEVQERALHREIEREHGWRHGEKRKNHPELRLAEDGELAEVSEDSSRDSPQREQKA